LHPAQRIETSGAVIEAKKRDARVLQCVLGVAGELCISACLRAKLCAVVSEEVVEQLAALLGTELFGFGLGGHVSGRPRTPCVPTCGRLPPRPNRLLAGSPTRVLSSAPNTDASLNANRPLCASLRAPRQLALCALQRKLSPRSLSSR